MTTDNHNRPTDLAHCPADCTCRGTIGSPRAARQAEQARDVMPQAEYDNLIAQALALAVQV